MEIYENPIKTHYRIIKEKVKNQMKSYQRCYYIPLNDVSEKLSVNLESRKWESKIKTT